MRPMSDLRARIARFGAQNCRPREPGKAAFPRVPLSGKPWTAAPRRDGEISSNKRSNFVAVIAGAPPPSKENLDEQIEQLSCSSLESPARWAEKGARCRIPADAPNR